MRDALGSQGRCKREEARRKQGKQNGFDQSKTDVTWRKREKSERGESGRDVQVH